METESPGASLEQGCRPESGAVGPFICPNCSYVVEGVISFPTLAQISRQIMLGVQFGDFGTFEPDPDEPGERCYVMTGEQSENFQRACDDAARRVMELLIKATAPPKVGTPSSETLSR